MQCDVAQLTFEISMSMGEFSELQKSVNELYTKFSINKDDKGLKSLEPISTMVNLMRSVD